MGRCVEEEDRMEARAKATVGQVNESHTHRDPLGILLGAEMELGASFLFPRWSSDLDVGQGDVTFDLQRVYPMECLKPMRVVEKVLAVSKHLESIGAATD